MLNIKANTIEQYHCLEWLKKNEFDLAYFEIELISSNQIRITDGNSQQAILTADKVGNVEYTEVKGLTIDEQIAPFRWVDHGDSISLCHDVSEFRDEIFASAPDHDYFTVKGGGHDWEFLARLFIDKQFPELKKDIHFDSESGMFCAYSKNAEVLGHFALEFRKALDDEKMIQKMTKQFDDKGALEVAYNLKQFDEIVRDLKNDVGNNPDLFDRGFEANGEIEVFEFQNSIGSIRIDEPLGRLKFLSHDLKVMNYDVKNNHSNSDTNRFKQLYKAEIERQLARKEKAKQVEKDRRMIKPKGRKR